MDAEQLSELRNDLMNDQEVNGFSSNYKYLRYIGEGAYCQVVEARDLITGNYLAIKVF